MNVGRGAKMEYSARHLFQLISAFELINCGLPAATATQIVESDWKALAAGFGLFAKVHRTHLPESTYILIMNCALADLAEAHPKYESKVHVTVESIASLEYSLKDNDRRTARTFILLCASDIARSVLKACFNTARIEDPAHDVEFESWLVNYSDENDWMRAEGGWQDYDPGQRWIIVERLDNGRVLDSNWIRRPGTNYFDAIFMDSLNGSQSNDVVIYEQFRNGQINFRRQSTGTVYKGNLTPDGRMVLGGTTNKSAAYLTWTGTQFDR